MNVFDYKSPVDHSSLFNNVPIQYLDDVKNVLKKANIKYLIRYRGPRKFDINRYRHNRQSMCIKSSATHFAVYLDYSYKDFASYAFYNTFRFGGGKEKFYQMIGTSN